MILMFVGGGQGGEMTGSSGASDPDNLRLRVAADISIPRENFELD